MRAGLGDDWQEEPPSLRVSPALPSPGWPCAGSVQPYGPWYDVTAGQPYQAPARSLKLQKDVGSHSGWKLYTLRHTVLQLEREGNGWGDSNQAKST